MCSRSSACQLTPLTVLLVRCGVDVSAFLCSEQVHFGLRNSRPCSSTAKEAYLFKRYFPSSACWPTCLSVVIIVHDHLASHSAPLSSSPEDVALSCARPSCLRLASVFPEIVKDLARTITQTFHVQVTLLLAHCDAYGTCKYTIHTNRYNHVTCTKSIGRP